VKKLSNQTLLSDEDFNELKGTRRRNLIPVHIQSLPINSYFGSHMQKNPERKKILKGKWREGEGTLTRNGLSRKDSEDPLAFEAPQKNHGGLDLVFPLDTCTCTCGRKRVRPFPRAMSLSNPEFGCGARRQK